MLPAMERWWLSLIVVLCAGCGTPETRFLSWYPRPAALEVQSYSLHDPFPDEDAGPSMGVRPRIFLEPRSETRKNLDLRFIKAAYGFPTQRYATWGPSLPAGAVQYPMQPVWQAPPGSIASAPPGW